MSLERHQWGVDTACDEYVTHYRQWFDSLKLKPKKVLDIACGSGNCMTAWLSNQYDCFVLGVDKFAGPFEKAKSAIYLGERDATDFCATQQFDTVTSFEFIEHIPHYELLSFLANMRESLISGGHFVGTTPNGTSGNVMTKSANVYHVREWHQEELSNVLSHFFSESNVQDIGLNMLGFVCKK